MSETSHKRPMFFWGWLTLALAGIIWVSSYFFVDPPNNNQDGSALPWNATINAEGTLTVLGLTLGQSTTKDAMALYGKETKIILFSDKQHQPVSVEAFFEDMYIGYSLRGRLILTLETSTEQLEAMFSRGGRVKSADSGAHEITLAGTDLSDALNLPIRHLTYIPYPKINEETLLHRFGQPSKDSLGEDGVRRWHYPERQLVILFDETGRKVLEFGH
ncbi:MAG: hypothetical protein JSU84_06380 [Thiotrichales bacterium]|nr:MAG: hypothetical protein JSU84_06380 [Thiotrichales bacterium]